MANKLIAFHGGGGNAGPGGYGALFSAPAAPWYTTILPDQMQNADWATIRAYVDSRVQVGDNVIVTGFSVGCLPVQKCLANCMDSVWKGALRGVIVDDPAADFSLTFPTEVASGVRRSLWCAQWSGSSPPANDWTVETITGGGGTGAIANLSGRMGVPAQLNPYFNYHAPAECGNPQGGPELAQSSAWWSGGGVVTPPVEPPPTTGDTTTYQAENYMPPINPVANGGHASSDSPGYSGTGYVGYWWQVGETVRFTNVTGGTAAGNRVLRFRYRSAETTTNATRRLRVNGVDRGVITFTKNANAWTEATFTDLVVTNIPLNAGTTNTVELTIEVAGGVDLDYMLVDASGGTSTPPPVTGGISAPRVIAGENIFPADTLFYADITQLPLLSGGAALLAGHLNDPTFRPEWGNAGYTDQVTCDFGSGSFNGRPYGFPVTIVEANQPNVPISSVTYPSESDLTTAWPVPLTALQEHNSDFHVTALQKGVHKLHEAWDAHPGASSWTLGAEATWDLTSYAMRPAGWTSADGAGMPVLPLSVSDDEVLDLGEINHALRICVTYLQTPPGFIWPANHSMDPGNSRSPRLSAGHWLRLKANVDLAGRGLGPQATIIAKALKKHGAIVIDIGPFLKLNGLYGPRWNNNDLNTIRGLHAADFEVIDPTSMRVSTSDRNLWFKVNQNVVTPPPAVGTPIEWSDRAGSFTVKAEDPGYRAAAASALLAECQTGWDGIYLTDSLVDVRHGIGTNTAYDTNAEVQAVTTTLLSQIATSLQNAGFLAVAETPGISAFSSLNDTLEALATGVADREFLRNAAGTYNGQTVAVQQAANVVHSQADPQNAYAHFNVEGGIYTSTAAAIHALATYLVFNDGASVLGLAADTGYNDPPPYVDDFTFDYGAETAARTNPFTGVYMRKFANGLAITNLSTTQQTVTLGGTYYPKGSNVGQTTAVVAGSSGVVLRTTPTTTTPPPNPGGSTGTVQAETGTLTQVAGGGSAPLPETKMINMVELFHDGGSEATALRSSNIVQGASFKAVLTTTERNLVESQDLPLFYWVVTDASVRLDYPQTDDPSAASTMLTLESTDSSNHVYMFSGPEFDNQGGWRTRPTPDRPNPVTNGITSYTNWMAYYRTQLGFNAAPMDLDNPARGYKNVAVCSYAQSVHYAYELGFDAVLLERINDEISGMTPGMMMMRGASHQAGDKPWGIDYSTWRFWTSSPTEFNSGGTQTGGWSMAWFRRHYYHAWASGATFSHFEALDLRTGADGSGFNPLGREIRDGASYMQSHDRGTPVAPFAIVHDHYSGFEPKFGEYIQADYSWYTSLPYTAADTRLHNFLALAFPNYHKHGTLTPGGPTDVAQMRSVFTGSFGGDMRAFEPQGSTAYGESFDYFTENVPLSVLQRYKKVIYTATTAPTVVTNYVNAGGTALRSDSVNSTVLNGWAATDCPVRVSGATCVWLVGQTAAGYTVTILNIGGTTINPTITGPQGVTTPSVPAYDVGIFYIGGSGGGMYVATDAPGYTGAGYIGGWWQAGQALTVTINVSAAGNYDLGFRYRNAEPDGSSDRTMLVNGAGSTTVSFPTNTTAWTNNAWATKTQSTVPLVAGNNVIKLTVPSSTGNGLDLDSMTWAPTTVTTPPPNPGTGTGHWEFANNEFRDPQGRRLNLLGPNGPCQQFPAIDTPFIMNMPVTSPPTTPQRTTLTGKHADVQAWGWNYIRVICNVTTAGFTTYAQNLINEYTPLGIVVAFCHLPAQDAGFDPPVNLQQTQIQESLNFYRTILGANPNNNYIWCDPGGELIRSGDGTYWSQFYTAYYNQLRAMPGGAFTPMFVTCKGFGQDLAGCVPLWSAFASGKSRVILDWHAYMATLDAAGAQTQFNAIRAANIPFFTQEGGYMATPASGPPAGFNPGACCGSDYVRQRAGVLQIINSWVPTYHHSMAWWTACGDDNQTSGHSLRYNGGANGTYQDFNMPFSEFGQKYWNEGQKSRFY